MAAAGNRYPSNRRVIRTFVRRIGPAGVRQFMVGLLPAISQPVVKLATNTNAFGSKIHPDTKADRYASQQSFSSTPDFWKGLAQQLRQSTGFDTHPESWRSLAMETGGIGALVDHMARSAIEHWCEPVVHGRAAVHAEPDFSSQSYQGRELAKFRASQIVSIEHIGTLRDTVMAG